MTCETCLGSQIQSDQEGEELLQLGRSLYKEMARLGAGRGAGERDRERSGYSLRQRAKRAKPQREST